MGRPTKKKNPADHRDWAKSLTTAEQFYITENGDLSLEEIARNLNKPIDLVQAFATDWIVKHPPHKENPRALNLMRGAHRTFGSTEASSMHADEVRQSGNSKLLAIANAMKSGQKELAERLREEYDKENELKRKEKIRNKYNQKVHFIRPPDDSELG